MNGLRDYLFRSIQIFDTTSYANVLDAVLRLEFRVKKSQVKKEIRRGVDLRDLVDRSQGLMAEL